MNRDHLKLGPNADHIGKLILRLAVAGIVLFHGVFKLGNGVEWIKATLADLGLPGLLAYGSYVAELVVPILLIIGYQVRLAALVLVFHFTMAIVLVFRGQVFAMKEMGGGWAIELEALLLLAAGAMFFLGAGKYSLQRTDT